MNAHRLYAASKRRREVSRRRSLLGLTALFFILALSIFTGSNFAAAHGNSQEEPVRHKYYRSIEVQSGDTLWDIAEKYADQNHSDIHTYVKEMKEINQLQSDEIQDSQFLTVAYYDSDFR